jgi:hypothetical protein
VHEVLSSHDRFLHRSFERMTSDDPQRPTSGISPGRET